MVFILLQTAWIWQAMQQVNTLRHFAGTSRSHRPAWSGSAFPHEVHESGTNCGLLSDASGMSKRQNFKFRCTACNAKHSAAVHKLWHNKRQGDGESKLPVGLVLPCCATVMLIFLGWGILITSKISYRQHNGNNSITREGRHWAKSSSVVRSAVKLRTRGDN